MIGSTVCTRGLFHVLIVLLFTIMLNRDCVSQSDLRKNVLIVKQGMEHNRTHDGNTYGIVSYHRYRIDLNSQTGFYDMRLARHDVQQFHDYDVDNDGQVEDDTVGTHAWDLSLDNPVSMVAPWYDTSIGTQRFCGGLAIYQADSLDAHFTEDGMNDTEEGDEFQPRRNWTFFNEILDIDKPYQMAMVLVWQKPDFINGGNDGIVTFDDTSEMRCWIGRYNMGIDADRWIVRNDDQFYISEATFQEVGVHKINPTQTRWAEFDPKPPYHFLFDPANGEFKDIKFDNITAVGWSMFKTELITGYVGCKWEAFEVTATVLSETGPSSMIEMATITDKEEPKFHITKTEIPFGLYSRIQRIARTPAHAGYPGFVFDDRGQMGSADYTLFADPDHEWKDPAKQPVTSIHIYDMLAWANALSIYESRIPCYYTDPEFNDIYRKVQRSPIYKDPLPTPTIYVKWDADGFRLPTPGEWATANSKQEAPPETYKATQAVNAGIPDAMGIQFMRGNVWEPVWTYGDELQPRDFNSITVLGGSFLNTADPALVSANPWGDKPFYGRFDIGLRLIRRESGLPSPSMKADLSGVPVWEIHRDLITEANVMNQIITRNGNAWLSMLPVADTGAQLARTETTYAQWMPVYHWAVRNGYNLDHYGNIGSSDYWGFGEHFQHPAYTIHHPVTGITHHDVLLWLNALSEIEGRTPVYYADSAFKEILKETKQYRPLMLTHENLKKYYSKENDLNVGNRNDLITEYYINQSANGFRLPSTDLFKKAAWAGNKGLYPWGQDMAKGLEYAWVASNSGFHTHPVGQKKPNSWGFYDTFGNVSELSEITNRIYTPRLYMSFLDILDNYKDILRRSFNNPKGAPTQVTGLPYHDIGFRASVRPQPMVLTSAFNAFLPLSQVKNISPDAFDRLQGRTHRANQSRTAEFQKRGLEKANKIKWTFSTQGPVKSSPVVVGDTLFIGSDDHHIYAINKNSGDEIWSFDTRGKVSGSATVKDGIVYIASESGNLFALEAKTGKVKWQAPTRSKTAGTAPVIENRIIIGAGARGGSVSLGMMASPMMIYDVQTGKHIASGSSGPQGYAAIATDGENLYAGTSASNYAAFSLEDGKAAWIYRSGHQRRQFMSMTVKGDYVYIPVTIGGYVVKVAKDTGREVWINAANPHNLRYQMNQGGKFGHEIFTDLALDASSVYAGFNDGQFISFNQETGKKNWSFNAEGKIQSSPSIAGGNVYFGSHDGYLYAINCKNGMLVWKFSLGAKITASPWPGNDVIFIADHSGKVYAIE